MQLICNALFGAMIVGAFEFAPDVMKIDHFDVETQEITVLYINKDTYISCLQTFQCPTEL